ncbi:MAG: response regulator [Thiomicrospira sp.]
MLKSCGHSLLGLINDILDYSKIEAGKLELERLSVNPRQLLDELRFVFEPQLRKKGLALCLQIAPDVPQWIETDPTRLRQVFYNLMANAIKFSTQGKICLSLSPATQPGQLRGAVRDQGIGIPAETQQRLLTPFQQADTSITRQYGGTGLGLAICAKLCQALGGTIGVDSEVGKGSEFYFTFNAPQACAPAPISTPANQQSVATLSVLLVEDNPINQMLALKLLEKLGIKADLSRDGLEAIEAMQQHHYDLVLMDMQMPKMDGLSATRYIRALDHLHQPRIIALTANAFTEDQQACKSAGMNGFLTKPITLDALQQAIFNPDQAW